MNYEIKLRCKKCLLDIAKGETTQANYVRTVSQEAFRQIKCPRGCQSEEPYQIVTEIIMSEI